MRVFKRKRKVGKRIREDKVHTLEFRDHLSTPRRLPAFTDLKLSEELGRMVDRLIATRTLRQAAAPDLQAWMMTIPADLRERLAEMDLLDKQAVAVNRPLSDHLDEFQTNLRATGATEDHCSLVSNRARAVFKSAGFQYANEIVQDGIENALAKLKAVGKSQQTINHHVRAVKQFSRWMVRNGRMHTNPVAELTGGNVETDRRLERRELSTDELQRLLTAAKNGPVRYKLTGEQRYMLYAVALGTGFRASECRSLTPRSFNLAGNPPAVRIDASDEKARRGADIPLPPDLSAMLAKWFAGKPADAPLWPGEWAAHKSAAKFIAADLKAARKAWLADAKIDAAERLRREQSGFLAYRNDDGQADFHALRHTYLSRLGRSGASAKVMQKLARHSTVELTLGRYTHADLFDLAGAVGKLPELPSVITTEPEVSALRMTGTDAADTPPKTADGTWTENGPFSVPISGKVGHVLAISDSENHPSVPKRKAGSTKGKQQLVCTSDASGVFAALVTAPVFKTGGTS